MVKCNLTMYLEGAELEIFGEKDYLPRIYVYVQEWNRWVIVYACTSFDQEVANSRSWMAVPFCFTGLPSYIVYYFLIIETSWYVLISRTSLSNYFFFPICNCFIKFFILEYWIIIFLYFMVTLLLFSSYPDFFFLCYPWIHISFTFIWMSLIFLDQLFWGYCEKGVKSQVSRIPSFSVPGLFLPLLHWGILSFSAFLSPLLQVVLS